MGLNSNINNYIKCKLSVTLIRLSFLIQLYIESMKSTLKINGLNIKIKRRCVELNANENSQNLWDSAEAGLTGKFISLNVYIRKGRDSNQELQLPP